MNWDKTVAILSILLGVISLINEPDRLAAAIFLGAVFLVYIISHLVDEINKNEDRLKTLENSLNINYQLIDIKARLVTTEQILASFINSKMVVNEAKRKWTKR